MENSKNQTGKRMLSLWLPYWPTDRLYRAQYNAQYNSQHHTRQQVPEAERDKSLALALIAAQQGGQRVAAVNAAAAVAGIGLGMMLTDARALLPGLSVHPMAPEEDARALAGLADWCGRYSPWVSLDNEDGRDAGGQYGICLDVTGCAHLFGGEDAMLTDLARRLHGFAIQARLAIADSLGAAWAVARYGGEDAAIVPAGEIRAALECLPVAALRLSPGAADALARLGLGRIGELYALPRGALTARFGREVTYHLDQALAKLSEPLSPRPARTSFWSRLAFAEPIGHRDHIARAAGQLVDDLCAVLEREERGARRIELRLYLADGTVRRIRAGLNRASRQPAHLSRLLAEHLPSLEAGFGADLMVLMAGQSDPLPAGQRRLDNTDTNGATEGETLEPLLDRLGNRLGAANVASFMPVQSHLPEQAARLVPPLSQVEAGEWRHVARRPVYLLPRPELVEAVAEVPDGPPVLFRWRGIAHRVQRGDGPERIAPEWWHDMQAGVARLAGETRDYYRIEDSRGQRYWLYRRGLYGSDAAQTPSRAPDWYLHGFFA
ncbi:MAG: DNA polymerase Y family protein [Rhodospirillaceae bacterium]|nr:DNA polymerase Y family protein [Rhodospirillaceae bacterium]